MRTTLREERATLIRYLLGELPEAERERIGELCMLDESYANLLDELEMELVDRYVEGALTGQQRHDFERRYLVTLERKAAVQAAHLLRAYRDRVAGPKRPASKMWPKWRTGRQFVAALAAGLTIVAASCWLLLNQRQVQRGPESEARNSQPGPTLAIQQKAAGNSPGHPTPGKSVGVRADIARRRVADREGRSVATANGPVATRHSRQGIARAGVTTKADDGGMATDSAQPFPKSIESPGGALTPREPATKGSNTEAANNSAASSGGATAESPRSPAESADGVAAATADGPIRQIGVYYRRAANWIGIEPEEVSFKSGGVLKSLATDGLIKGDVNGHLKGAHSKTEVSGPVEILIYAPDGVAPTEYQLLYLRESGSDAREFRTITGGVFHKTGGGSRDAIAFEARKIAPHTFVITLDHPKAGEYGLLPPDDATNSLRPGKLYTFHVIE